MKDIAHKSSKGSNNLHRLIMSINPGRSGSKYLSILLNTARNITAFHEPVPGMSGRYIKLFPAENPSWKSRLLYYAIYMKKMTKVRAINRVLKNLPPQHSYAETNHMFILSFYDVIMKHFHKVDVIHLRRYMPKVLKSYIETNNFAPGFHNVEGSIKREEKGEFHQTKYWCVSPNSQSAAVKALALDTELDQFDLCIGYLIDIEARAQRFKRQFPHVKLIEAQIESLNNIDGVSLLFKELRAELSHETEKMVGQVQNRKFQMKKDLGINISEEYCRERIHQYIEKCKSAGISLPSLPNFY